MHEIEEVAVRPTDRAALAASAPPLSGDMLYGADGIAEFLFGDRKHRRKVYNLVETGQLPVFRLGANICARKSVLLDWIGRQESAATLAAAGQAEAPLITAR